MEREIFTKGTEVEAFFDDPGLRCAWFTATVLREPSRDNKIFLQFHTLLSDGKHQKPLQERLNVVNVRPLPPREAYRTFKMNEEVDAFCDDGWWEGVITEVHGSDRFSVYLRGTKDQRVFPASVLRLRREWVSDGWVPPLEDEEEDNPVEDEEEEEEDNPVEEDDQSLLSKSDGSNVPKPAGSSKKHPSKSEIVLPKSKGSNVQKPEGSSRTVSSKSKSVISKPAGSNVSKPEGNNVPKPEGSSKSKSVLLNPEGRNMQKPEGISKNHSSMSMVEFEEGTEVEISSDQPGFLGAWFVATYVKEVRNRHLIEHRHFFTRSDGVMRLKERVDARHIRPLPPEIPVIGRFKRLEEVDAWYSESWWVGVISEVLDNSKYKVYFRHNKEELEFEHSNLRYHQDWVDGQWVRASLVNVKPKIPTKAVCAELELRKEIPTLNLQKQLQNKEAEASSLRENSYTEIPSTPKRTHCGLDQDRPFIPDPLSFGGERIGKRDKKRKAPGRFSEAPPSPPQSKRP